MGGRMPDVLAIALNLIAATMKVLLPIHVAPACALILDDSWQPC